MIVVMSTTCSEGDIENVMSRIQEVGLAGHLSRGVERTVIGVVGQTFPELREMLETLGGVDSVVPISRPYKLGSREFEPQDSTFTVGGVTIGGPNLVVIAGPCAVESEQQVMDTAKAVKAAGAHILRGGAFKPRSSPYTFRGLAEEGLRILADARAATGLPVITEVMTPQDIDLVARYADILQIGARNMQNFMLLDEVGETRMPVMLKRGMSATIEEWLLCAEYILSHGNREVMLCERGIRTFETYTRNTMDVSAIAAARRLSHLPVIGDPSHGTGRWHLVRPLALAAVAAGAQGLMVEVHPTPERALSDGAQSLTFENFAILMEETRRIAEAAGRPLAPPIP